MNNAKFPHDSNSLITFEFSKFEFFFSFLFSPIQDYSYEELVLVWIVPFSEILLEFHFFPFEQLDKPPSRINEQPY